MFCNLEAYELIRNLYKQKVNRLQKSMSTIMLTFGLLECDKMEIKNVE